MFLHRASFDMCTLSVRQAVLGDCEYYTLFNGFALCAAPQLAVGYTVEGIVVNLLTAVRGGREQWRLYGVGALAEAFWFATAPIDIPRDGLGVFMYYCHLTRQPPPPPPVVVPPSVPLILILLFPFPSNATLQRCTIAPTTLDALADTKSFETVAHIKSSHDLRLHPAWMRFKMYASHVQEIALSFFPRPQTPSLWTELDALLTKDDPILSRLHRVTLKHWYPDSESREEQAGQLALLSPSVRWAEIQGAFHVEDWYRALVANHFLARCPDLEGAIIHNTEWISLLSKQHV
ncbi:uncharacterized protein BXZ73DRAFT_103927 [Epithele typhae]|uniref:uncharacterized protein n=1 Tax=Epithele typhae TaxID=378194 RepID=UPI00200747F9|nr:uncharacterized protein BXZ73DRAFT_103927 [Epithele typhae]KAH9923129.1 hypothetical protein BXZ73DRAFT_103927 [Epithele typhae]